MESEFRVDLEKPALSVGILTISDRCSRGLREDASGEVLKAMARERQWQVLCAQVVPDEKSEIQSVLLEWCDWKRVPVILTTGGTGIGPRDVTPEATRGILEKELRGLSELMRSAGLASTPLAALSRALAGVRGGSLIINLPGSPKGCRESLAAVMDVIPHALQMIQGQDHGPASHEEVKNVFP